MQSSLAGTHEWLCRTPQGICDSFGKRFPQSPWHGESSLRRGPQAKAALGCMTARACSGAVPAFPRLNPTARNSPRSETTNNVGEVSSGSSGAVAGEAAPALACPAPIPEGSAPPSLPWLQRDLPLLPCPGQRDLLLLPFSVPPGSARFSTAWPKPRCAPQHRSLPSPVFILGIL